MNDSFHYVANKKRLLKEIFRVVTDRGLVILVHVHDPRDLSGERVPGEPLEPKYCVRLIHEVEADASVTLFSEREFLTRYYQGDEIRISDNNYGRYFEKGPYLVFASRSSYPNLSFQNLSFQKSRDVLRPYPLEKLVLNPVYQASLNQQTFTCKIDWPDSPTYEEFGIESYLPKQIRIRRTTDLAWLNFLRLRAILIPDPNGTLGIPIVKIVEGH
jgi:hypothetical protein